MAEYRAIARPDPDDSKTHPCNRLRPKRLRRKTPAKLLDVLLLRQRSGGVRLVLSLRPNRTICPLGKVTVRLAHRVSTIRLVLVHFKAPAPVPVHPTDTRAQLDPSGLLAPPLRRCRRGNRAAEHQDPRRRGRIRTAG